MAEEYVDFRFSDSRRKTNIVRVDEAIAPVAAGFFCAPAVVERHALRIVCTILTFFKDLILFFKNNNAIIRGTMSYSCPLDALVGPLGCSPLADSEHVASLPGELTFRRS